MTLALHTAQRTPPDTRRIRQPELVQRFVAPLVSGKLGKLRGQL